MMRSTGNSLGALHGMDEGNALLGTPAYNGMVQSKVSDLPTEQQAGGFAKIDQTFRDNPQEISENLNKYNS